MRTVTIREAREGLSHLEQLFADGDEVIVTRRGEPVARIYTRLNQAWVRCATFWPARRCRRYPVKPCSPKTGKITVDRLYRYQCPGEMLCARALVATGSRLG